MQAKRRPTRKVTLYLPTKIAERVDAVEKDLDPEIVTGRYGIAVRKLLALGLAAMERAR